MIQMSFSPYLFIAKFCKFMTELYIENFTQIGYPFPKLGLKMCFFIGPLNGVA